MLNHEIKVKTENFDGPFGLLLLLLQKEEMNIKDIDIKKITETYLDYLSKMQELNFDVAGDYLLMAATLVLLKSKAFLHDDDIKDLLGETDDNIPVTSRAELIYRLEELQRFQGLGNKLWGMERLGEHVFTRPKTNKKHFTDNFIGEMDINELIQVMLDHLFRLRRKYKVVKRDRLSIKEKLVTLKKLLRKDESFSLLGLVESDKEAQQKAGGVTNLVITFISLLELARLKKVRVMQDQESKEIMINVVEDLDDFNVEVADGFEEEGEEDEVNMDELKVKEAPTDILQ